MPEQHSNEISAAIMIQQRTARSKIRKYMERQACFQITDRWQTNGQRFLQLELNVLATSASLRPDEPRNEPLRKQRIPEKCRNFIAVNFGDDGQFCQIHGRQARSIGKNLLRRTRRRTYFV